MPVGGVHDTPGRPPTAQDLRNRTPTKRLCWVLRTAILFFACIMRILREKKGELTCQNLAKRTSQCGCGTDEVLMSDARSDYTGT
jgi:hypothetical protein